LALALGAGGGAATATGGNFILGETNTETTTATLSNTKGSAPDQPCSLVVPA
jgi:hypothetical protein